MTIPTVTPTARTIDLLHKQKRVHKTGCTLSAANIQMLAENFVLLINHQMLENWQPLLNDRSDMSLVLREHDFEFFKAARSFVQSINSLKKMLDLRIEEINKLIEENRPLFDQWNKEWAEKFAAEKLAAGMTCEDEGCPQFGTPHSHIDPPIDVAAIQQHAADVVKGTELAAIPAVAANDTPPAPEAA